MALWRLALALIFMPSTAIVPSLTKPISRAKRTTCTNTSCKKQWQVEVFHKSLKFNANLAKSPTQTLRTQSNHVFMSIYAVFKLQCLSIKTRINPFALRLKLLINASRSAYAELQQWQAAA